MVAYTYSRVSALNFNTTPLSVAKSATGAVYAIADTTFTTPLNVTMVVGGAVTAVLSSDANGFFPDFTVADRTSVVWKQNSSAFTTVLTTTDVVPGATGEAGPPGAPGAAGARGDLATWQGTTFYPLNQVIANPSGDLVKVTTAHTSGATYDATKFGLVNNTAAIAVQETRLAAVESNLNQIDLITNGSFRGGLTGWTNTGAWVVQTSTNSVTSWARTMSGADGAFAQSIVVPEWLRGKILRLKAIAKTTSTGTLLTRITTTAGATSLNHTLTTSYVEYTLDVTIPATQGATPITLDIGRYSGTVYMTAIRLESI